MKKIGKIFISVIILVSAYLFIDISYHNYTNYNRLVKEQIKFMEFILLDSSWLKTEHFIPEKDESKELIEWINGQTNPIYINNELYKYYVGHDNLNKHGYIYLSNNQNKLKNLRFNNRTSNGIYSLKENYFLEYLFTKNYSVVIASLNNTENNKGE